MPGSRGTTVCVVCGAPLHGRRADARHCGAPCRARGSLLRRILDGEERLPYSSVEELLARSRKRTQAGSRPSGPEKKTGRKVR